MRKFVGLLTVDCIMAKKASKQKNYTFIDLFAGIGGFHQAMHSVGMKCVFASEWDKNARISYIENYKNISLNSSKMIASFSITISRNRIRQRFPLLTFAAPGSPPAVFDSWFEEGFEDTRGTLFFNIANIVKQKIDAGTPPKVLFFGECKRPEESHEGSDAQGDS